MHCINCDRVIDYDPFVDAYRDAYGFVYCEATDLNDAVLHEVN